MNRQQLIMGHFKKATSEPNPYVKYAISEEDINTWYCIITVRGNDDEFEDGEYLVRLFATDRFPFKAPHFYFMTENGVYSVEKKVCIHIGEFHDGSYPATFGLSQFALELANGMIGWKSLNGGIALLTTSITTKRHYATISKETNNEKHANLIKLVNDSYDIYSKKWADKPVVGKSSTEEVDMSMFSN